MWAGGLLALVWVVGPLLSKGPDERGRAWAILGRFGKLAGLSIMVLIVTGLYKSGQQVASLDGLLTTLYGQALLVKIELVLFGAGLGLLNAAVLHPKVASGLGRVLGRRAGWRPFAPRYLGRALLVEVVSLALVLLVVGLLGTVQPARGPEFDPPLADNTASSSLSTQMSDLVVTLSIKPNRPGQNFLNLGIYNTRRPAPAPIEAVTLQLQPPNGGNAIELPLETQGNGRYQIAGEYLNVAGDWKISLRAIRPGLADTNLTVPWQVGPGLVARRPVVFSNQPVGSWLTLAAIGLSVAAGLGLLLFQARWKLYQKLFNKLTFNQPLKIGRNLRPHPDKREQ